MNENILDKVRKLLELSKNNTNINEANAALAQAQALMTKHRLSMFDLDKKIGDLTEVDLPQGKRNISWKSQLLNGICKNNNCKTIIMEGKGISYRIIGTETDIELVKFIYDTIVAQIEFHVSEALRNNLGTGKTFTNNFKLAAVQTVIQRMNEANKKVMESVTNAMVFVNTSQAKIASYVENNIGKLRPHKYAGGALDEDGWQLGTEAGRKVSWNKGIAGSKPNSLEE